MSKTALSAGLSKQSEQVLRPAYAAVDIGSNSVSVAFYAVDPKGELVEIEVEDKASFPCSLAEDMERAETAEIKPANLICAKKALEAIVVLLGKYGISPENVEAGATAWARAIEHTAAGKKVIQELRDVFAPYTFQIYSEDAEAKLVYETALLDPLFQLTTGLLSQQGDKACPIGILATGGASTEACLITPNGRIIAMKTIFSGMLTLKKVLEKRGTLTAAAKSFVQNLKAHHIFDHKTAPFGLSALFVIGGAYRTLAKAVCANKHTFILGADLIQDRLSDAAAKSNSYYEEYPHIAVNKRAGFMALAAEVLGQTVQYTSARNLIFLSKKMTDAMAVRVHQRALARAKRPVIVVSRNKQFVGTGNEVRPAA